MLVRLVGHVGYIGWSGRLVKSVGHVVRSVGHVGHVGWSRRGRDDGSMRWEIQFRVAGHITPWVLRFEWYPRFEGGGQSRFMVRSWCEFFSARCW